MSGTGSLVFSGVDLENIHLDVQQENLYPLTNQVKCPQILEKKVPIYYIKIIPIQSLCQNMTFDPSFSENKQNNYSNKLKRTQLTYKLSVNTILPSQYLSW